MATRLTVNYHKIILTREESDCIECSLAKDRQKDVPIPGRNQNSDLGERLFIEIISIKSMIYRNKKYWNLIVDESTNMMWSLFLPQKSDLPDRFVKLLKMLESQHKVTTKFI